MDKRKSKTRKRNSGEPLTSSSQPKRMSFEKRNVKARSSIDEGGEKIDAEYSGMKEPPLIKQLKRILSEYPDNGQIIKELIQNAEDAEASEVQVIYDERKINQEYGDQHWFTKFFRGPALCVTNDAKFTEKDWIGIKMIASSVKEENKLKVGRFGMGFKSVFHMTDYPCILSGDRILCIDPTGASDKINAEMKLKDLRRYKGMDVDAFFKAFGETIGIRNEVIETGYYKGTAFWFPFRCQQSKVSATVYSKPKTMELFMSFAHDASMTLLFLCHLVKVSLKIKHEDSSQMEDIVTSAVGGDTQRIIKERKSFVKAIEESLNLDHEPIVCTYDMVVNICDQNEKRRDQWRIMHYYIGNNASKLLRELGSNPDLGFCQCVGIALPINSSAYEHFESRVFCFLPLPKESHKQTGLPVHVNGFFALSQNRHHLKWPSDDQNVQNVTDSDIIWNRLLIDECLVKAFIEMIKVTKSKLIQHRTPDKEDIDVMYRLVPNPNEVVGKWKRLTDQLNSFLQSFEFLYARRQSTFLSLHTASFAILKDLPKDILHIKADIIQTLETCDVSYVDIDEKTFEKLTCYSNCQLNILTPIKLADILRNNVESLKQMSIQRKYSILCYLLSGDDSSILQNLPLIHTPGGWKIFEKKEEIIYICSLQQVPNLFPSVQHKVVVRTEDMVDYMWTRLGDMANSSVWQLRTLCPRNLTEFIKLSLDEATNSSGINLGQEKLGWFEELWWFIDENMEKGNIQMNDLKDLRLIPDITTNTQEKSGYVKIYKMSSYFLEQTETTSTEIFEVFSAFGVIILSGLPVWVPKQKLNNNLYSADDCSLRHLLGKIARTTNQDEISKFNTLKNQTKEAFVKFLCDCDGFDRSTILFLDKLNLFRRLSRCTDDTLDMSINESSGYFRRQFPVNIQNPIIAARTNDVWHLLVKLSAKEVPIESLVRAVIDEIRNNTFRDDMDLFMKYFCDNIDILEASKDLIKLAKEIPFLKLNSGERKKPSEVFDPTESILTSLFQFEKNKFPILDEYDSIRRLSAVRLLGLRGSNSLTAEDIALTALELQKLNASSNEKSRIRQKSLALMNILDKKTSLLQEHYDDQKLIEYLKAINWVQTIDKPEHLPSYLYIIKDTRCKPITAKVGSFKNACLVASVVPLVPENFENLGYEYGWFEDPIEQDVVKQLMYVRKLFTIEEKASTISVLDEIYSYMSHLTKIPPSLISEKWVWIGENFETPENVIYSKEKSDIESLAPYYYTIPSEFTKYKRMFQLAGCHVGQTIHVLLQTVNKIEKKHQHVQQEEEYEKDFNLLLTIIEKLAERRNELKGMDVPLPIKSDQPNRIMFLPASQCTVDKNSCNYTLPDGVDSIAFVSDRLSVDVAKALGAKPLNKQILSGTEAIGVFGFGQREKLTDRLKKLVDESYKDGVSVPKELIQNADDAGATIVKFLYDERDHQKQTLFSTEMEQCQGPSLFVYNNASFSKSDMENITKLNGATKENDTSKIGRFGLGFCAVYNLTDVPSFVTRNSFVTFDPNKTHLSKFVDNDSPGIRIDFNKHENHKLIKIYADQFRPFDGIFGFETSSLKGNGYDGTLFRLPFRTRCQAQKSEIRNYEYSTLEVLKLLEIFIKEASNLLLFTQNVFQLELHYISRNANSIKDQVLIFETKKAGLEIVPSLSDDTNRTSVLKRAAESIKSNQCFKEIHKFTIQVFFSEVGKIILPALDQIASKVDFSWLVVWESGQEDSLTISNDFAKKGALPLAAIAVVCEPGFTSSVSFTKSLHYMYNSGRFFCFLPLPIKTGLEVHINCSFDITSDRQTLNSTSDDDKESLKSEWNRSLLADPAVNGFFSLLEILAANEADIQCFYQLWPLKYQPIAESLYASFFTRLIEENRRLFYGQGQFVSFDKLIYLDPHIRNHPEIGEPGYKMLLKIAKYQNKVIVDIPLELEKALKKYHDISGSCIGDQDLIMVFLKHIKHNYWIDHTNDRNKLLIYALQSGNENIHCIMKDCACIPVQPDGNLKKPSQTIDQKGEVSCLFNINDAVFPLVDFQTGELRSSLKRLGMMSNKLTDAVLYERCVSVEKIARTICAKCALQRCHVIIRYIMKKFIPNIYVGENIGSIHAPSAFTFRDTYILPVLQKPENWIFTWYACTDTRLIQSNLTCLEHSTIENIHVTFGKPSCLFRTSDAMLIGIVASLMDERNLGDLNFPSNLWEILGVNVSIPTDFVVRQLICISKEYNNKASLDLIEILKQTYTFLQQAIKRDIAVKNVLAEKLNDKAIILLDGKLYSSNVFAFSVYPECKPYLNKLPQNEALFFEDFFCAIGVKNQFSVDDIISVLKEEKVRWKNTACNEIDIIIGLLQNLVMCSDVNNRFSAIKDFIIAPDTNGNLHRMYELAIADDTFEIDMPLKILHKSVPPSLALKLGAKLKKQKCLENSFSSIGKPFGQKEKLVSRLHNLLKAYPCDSSIMKELLQNADDAFATEIVFIKDFRKLSTDKIFADECKHLQGPSLCVFNNKYFTINDLQGIQDLGEGSKRDDATKTGQYGVGFNAVYHLTDTPSFLTNGPTLPDDGLLCIFDPTCNHIPGVPPDNPGIKSEVKSLQKCFPGALLGFHEGQKLFMNDIGTLFRFPLRQSASDISRHTFDSISVDNMLKGMTEDMFISLLFVKHVKHIRISDISSGMFEDDYSVTAEISDEDYSQRSNFFRDLKDLSKKLKQEQINIFDIGNKQTSYNIKISDTAGRTETYFVVLRFGYEGLSETPSKVMKAIADKDLGCLPLGGVAIRTSKEPLTDSKAFCFLPLPGITGLPVHINGHFALNHESRRELWRGDQGQHVDYRQEWNECMIRGVVVPAYMQCLCHQRDIISKEIKSTGCDLGEHGIESKLMAFYAMLPIYNECRNEYWKYLTKLFYTSVTEEKWSLFPVVDDNFLACEWVALGRAKETAYGYFEYPCKNRRKLISILKLIGMQVIHTPLQFKETIEDSGIEGVLWTSPDEVLRFLATSGHPGTNSKISINTTKLVESPIKSIQNWIILFVHVSQSSCFVQSISEIPLLPTNDGYLRPFVKNPAVYMSEYSWMFPDFQNRFIHSEITKVNSAQQTITRMVKAGFLHKLSLNAFEEFMPRKYRNILEKDIPILPRTRECPNDEWIVGFWKCLYELTERQQQAGYTITFKESVSLFTRWCLIPAVMNSEFKLVQLQRTHILIDLDSYQTNRNVHVALTKLSLPSLDDKIFGLQAPRINFVLSSVFDTLKDLTTSYRHPERFLDFLSFWIEYEGPQVFKKNLNERDAVSLLKYLSNHLHGTQLWQDYSCREKLRSLPLFVSITGSLCALNGERNVYLIPSNLPLDGLNGLVSQCNILLLKPFNDLEVVYNALSLSATNLDMLYAETILPNIDSIPTEMWLPHITFLKDYFFKVRGHESSYYFQRIIDYLKSIPFVPTERGYKKCSEFYHHQNLVFKKMCQANQFLPNPFRKGDWPEFISVLGMHTEVTDNMLIRFAAEIDNHPIFNAHVKEKSEVLVKCFIDRIKLWNERTLETIKTITFIQPVDLRDVYQNLFPQRKDKRHFICTSGSAIKQNIYLCWSTLKVLPFDIPAEKRSILGIEDISGNVNVLKHIQNISTELENKIKDMREEDVVFLVKKVYEFLKQEKNHDYAGNNAKDMLSEFPIIHLPKHVKMVKVIDVVVNLPQADDLKPYLFHAPHDYGEFFEIFKLLGVYSELQCCHCLNILFKIYVNANKEEVLINDLRHVKGALSRLHALLQSNTTTSWGPKKMYLPNIDKVMTVTTDLVVCDNIRLRERANISTINFFLGFANLELGEIDSEIFVNSLPKNLRPKLLTEIILERFDTSRLEYVNHSLLASRFTSFIRSTEFIVGVCRVAKKFMEQAGKQFDRNENVKRIKEMVLQIFIKEVKQLETVLEYNGTVMHGTNESRPCFHEKSEDKLTFYFTNLRSDIEETLSDILCSTNGLARVLVQCIELPFEAEMTIMALLRKYNDPLKVRRFLDEERFPSLEVDSSLINLSAFPKPGTYVDEHLHPFLEQALTLFDESEYLNVALQLEDGLSEDGNLERNPIYIYVHIIEEVEHPDRRSSLVTKYRVDIGEDYFVTIPAFKLFRFVRRTRSTDEISVYTGNVLESYLPLDENYRRIEMLLREAWTLDEGDRRKIIRRLLLEWHPDKNIGNEDFARQVFDFIKQLVERLGREQPVHFSTNTRHRSPRYYFNIFTNVEQRARTYARAYRENLSEYNRSYGTGNFSHTSERQAVVKDEYEAKRWIRQAKHDFRAAKEFCEVAEDPSAYNWICYTCHQASEKALKAYQFATNANLVSRFTHHISLLAASMPSPLPNLASELENHVGQYSRMRYPDMVNRPNIPAEIYTKEQAERAMELAKDIIDNVDEFIS